MTRRAIADTGPLVAFLDRAERHHHWMRQQVQDLEAPLLICEPVLAEAMFLLARTYKGQDALFGLLENGALRVALHVAEQLAPLRSLHRKYQDRPMSLADACVVRMAELHPHHAVLTLDSDFTIYRRSDGAHLALISPDAE